MADFFGGKDPGGIFWALSLLQVAKLHFCVLHVLHVTVQLWVAFVSPCRVDTDLSTLLLFFV